MTGDVKVEQSLLDSYLMEPQLIEASLIAEPDPQKEHGVRTPRAEPAAHLLGTGTPKILPTRAGPSTLLQFGDDKVLIDCGAGATERLVRLGVDPASLTHLLITHHHLDHNAELAWLMLSPWVDRTRQGCPVIVGPPGTAMFVNRLLAAYDYDIRTRERFGILPDTLAPRVLEVADGREFGGDGWRAVSFRVDHDPVDQAFGYRFDWTGGSLAISGDTAPCENLIDHCRGVDVLIHEALYPGFGFPAYHTTVDQVGKVAADAGAGHLVLTHLIPGHLPDEMWRHPVSRQFDGPITVGRDLLRVL